ncbi:MAG: hypothetical protein EXS38_02545 [Opitutus sp.]|nr:hypothetical protein [Opitutus sp.]
MNIPHGQDASVAVFAFSPSARTSRGLLVAGALLAAGLGRSSEYAPEKNPIPGLGVAMVQIQPGTFTLGRTPGVNEADADEGPVTTVTLTKGFWLGATEVTVGQWRQFIDATGYRTDAEKGDGIWVWTGPAAPRFTKRAGLSWRNPGFSVKQDDTHPVVGISWNDAQKFCSWLTDRERAAGRLRAAHVYTLPTEAQWEYACRLGTPGPDPENLSEVAWWEGNSEKHTHPVGKKKASAWGLYDMYGNVWEWCVNWDGPYPGGKVTDFRGASSGHVHENRGGGWNSGPGHSTSSTNRWDSLDVDQRRDNLGFRLCLSAGP